MKHNKGFSSLEFIVTLFFLSLILIALGIFLRVSDLTISKRTQDKSDKEQIDIVLNSIFEEIKKDHTPNVDSKMDPVWKFNDTKVDGFDISIQSLSGLINLNYIPKEILVNTILVSAFETQQSIDKIKAFIEEKGMINSYEEISDLISEEKFNENFTLYGYANFNVADESSLAFIGNTIIKSNFGDELVNKRKSLRNNKQFIQSETEFNMLCGIHFDDIQPYINLNPSLNVNFMNEEVLKSFLTYPQFKLSNALQKANTIISLRDSKELTQEELISILGISKNHELYYFIGSKTWFWQINVKGKNASCNVILARAPEDGTLGEPKFYLIEKRWI